MACMTATTGAQVQREFRKLLESREKCFRFPAENIDLRSRAVTTRGTLTVDSRTADLVFTSDDLKQTIRWPLNGIRRYGRSKSMDNTLKIEVGRRCPHGEGLYVFRLIHGDAKHVCSELNLISQTGAAIRASYESRRAGSGERNDSQAKKQPSLNYVRVDCREITPQNDRTLVLRCVGDELTQKTAALAAVRSSSQRTNYSEISPSTHKSQTSTSSLTSSTSESDHDLERPSRGTTEAQQWSEDYHAHAELRKQSWSQTEPVPAIKCC